MPPKSKTKKAPKSVKPKSVQKAAVKKAVPGGSGRHIYILIIMALIAAIFILLNSKNENFLKFLNSTSNKTEDIKKNKESVKQEKKETEDTEKKDQEYPVSGIKIYFIKINDATEKIVLTPVERNVKKGAELENAFIELIKGPTAKEKKNGILTAFPENVKLRKVTQKNGVAEVDFSAAIESGSGSDILMSRIDQIIWTATQVDGINGVQIKINGKLKATLGNEGISISGVLTRKK